MTIPTPATELRRIRLALGLSQAALAERLGCQQQHLSDWERGVREPRSSILLRVQAMEREKRESGMGLTVENGNASDHHGGG